MEEVMVLPFVQFEPHKPNDIAGELAFDNVEFHK